MVSYGYGRQKKDPKNVCLFCVTLQNLGICVCLCFVMVSLLRKKSSTVFVAVLIFWKTSNFSDTVHQMQERCWIYCFQNLSLFFCERFYKRCALQPLPWQASLLFNSSNTSQVAPKEANHSESAVSGNSENFIISSRNPRSNIKKQAAKFGAQVEPKFFHNQTITTR